MQQSTNNFPTGTRVFHNGTGERGTVLITGTDDLGLWTTVSWDDPDALEVPDTLHAKHLTVIPGTVTELIHEADRQGLKPSKLLQSYTDDVLHAEARRRNLLPPAGFEAESDDNGEPDYVGPKVEGDGFTIATYWVEGQGVEFYLDGENGFPSPFTEAQVRSLLRELPALIESFGLSEDAK